MFAFSDKTRNLVSSNNNKPGSEVLYRASTMKFKVEYSARFKSVSCRVAGVRKSDAGNPVEVFGDLRPEGVPADIFADFVRASEESRPIGETLLWKAIRPDVPAKYANKWGYWMTIHGRGMAPNYLAEVQQPGPYSNRLPTDIEWRFKRVFHWAVKVKWENARFPGSKNQEVEEMRNIVMQFS